jgi:hypothetical protein
MIVKHLRLNRDYSDLDDFRDSGKTIHSKKSFNHENLYQFHLSWFRYILKRMRLEATLCIFTQRS